MTRELMTSACEIESIQPVVEKIDLPRVAKRMQALAM